jgi:pyruvate/2-oxoglutarate/acetoin dehydrogenase E1 component
MTNHRKYHQAVWGSLQAPPKRGAAQDVPIPYNRTLENAVIPNVERITTEIRTILE